MRIVAGKYRRRKLLTNPGMTTRPITDRAKVILFDRLEPILSGARIADVFAGTGSMGLEALSRGAASVVFFESDHRAYELLLKNVAALKVEQETLCWRVDVLRTSFVPKGVPAFLPYDIVLFDPPYRMTEAIRPGNPLYRAWERLAGERVTAADALLVLRCATEAEFEAPPVWEIEQKINVNTMDLYLFRKAGRAGSPVLGEEPAPS
jgi:16S rRNA (guanine966-N2)-methyltransferase